MADSKKNPPRRAARGTGRTAEAAGGTVARGFRFGPVNYALFAGAFAVIVTGYLLLDRGSVTAAPLLLILGYLVLLPLGILCGWKRLESTSEDRPRS